MSKLNELIQELCPNGVEYRKISSFTKVLRGKRLTKDKLSEENSIPVYHGGIEPLGYYGKANRPANMVMIINVGASAGTVAYSDKEFWSSDGCFCIDKNEEMDDRYLYHYLKNNEYYFMSKVRKAGIPTLDNFIVEEFKIPVPPLEVQREIVHILDSFTLLTAELTAELTARKKQYEYYRDELLKVDDSIKTVVLEEIAENCDSLRKPVTSGNRKAGEYSYYGASGIVDYVSDYIFDGDYLLVSEDGANLLARSTPIAFSISGKNWVNNHAHVLKFETYATRRYVEFYLNSIDLYPWISGGAQPKLNQKNLNKINIPLPSLDEQERIVSILDRFDSLCNSISEGLPAEIEARQKQYEFYRDKLLSFKQL